MKQQQILRRSLFLSCFSVLFLFVGIAQNIPNPVLPNVADAGVLKYNGKYYIGGVFTDGDFYVSDDLVNWGEPIHVLTMDNDWSRGTGAGNNQIHANDMVYINGMFHFYWSVNHWGNDRHIVHVAHAQSDKVLGPYVEPVKDTWMDNRIDPKVFRDDDGKLYMYMVRFTDGNTIWVRPMQDAATFDGHPIYQFASLPNTWETMDNRVAEGPWVMKYRDRYYMMYNGNHTGTDWGNYQLGVAEADSPILFNNGNKYPYPLLLTNQRAMEEEYADLLCFNHTTYDPLFAYSTEQPAADWLQRSYADIWSKGKTGFGSREIKGSTVRRLGTEWRSERLYLQKKFTPAVEPGNLALRILHDGKARVYLNGKLIYDKESADYITINLNKEQRAALRKGENLLAVEAERGGRRNHLDIALFDVRQSTADDILFSPGQPNILRGPNGFEWWLIYMANKNHERRSQYINRIHFFNKTMYADGVTSNHTEGYFPEPYKATASTMAHPDINNKHTMMDRSVAGTSYLFEVGVNTEKEAGIFAWWKDQNNWIKVGLDASNSQWYWETSLQGKRERSSYALLPDFRFGVYHSLRIERNMNRFKVYIDDLSAPGQSWFTVPGVEGKAVPGLFAETESSFDGITYTLGWDEYDEYITPWGEYIVSSEGVKAPTAALSEAFKGDLLSQYEYSLQVTNGESKGEAGVYPVYVDKNNYVKAVFNAASGSFEVTAVQKGKRVYEESYPLEHLATHYADMRYTDSMDKGYTFNSPTRINEILLPSTAYDDLFDRMQVDYLLDGKWHALPQGEVTVAANPAYNKRSFPSLTAEGLRFINRGASDQERYIYTIRVNEQFKESYNLRTVKLKDKILLLVDGKSICTLDISYPAAQVGLYSQGCQPVYNGILLYHIP